MEKARPLVEGLDNEIYEEPRAYAKIVQGVLALKRGDARRAVISLREANQLFDTWIGQFDLGRASLEAGLFAQADSAFDACLNARRGEALALFVDEQPTYAYIAPVHYYLGRRAAGAEEQPLRRGVPRVSGAARRTRRKTCCCPKSASARACSRTSLRRLSRASSGPGGQLLAVYLLLSCAVTDTVGPNPDVALPVGRADRQAVLPSVLVVAEA